MRLPPCQVLRGELLRLSRLFTSLRKYPGAALSPARHFPEIESGLWNWRSDNVLGQVTSCAQSAHVSKIRRGNSQELPSTH